MHLFRSTASNVAVLVIIALELVQRYLDTQQIHIRHPKI